MKKIKLIGLILVILVGIVALSGCCCWVCDGFVTPSVQSCILTISAGYWVWGEIYLNGQPTGVSIDYQSAPSATIKAPCNQMVYIYIVDPCGYQSHTETIFITSGQNYLSFNYW